jgi:hypothetical protein
MFRSLMSNLNYRQFVAEIGQIGSMPPGEAAPFFNALAPLIRQMTATGLGTLIHSHLFTS